MNCIMDIRFGLLIGIALQSILKLPPTEALKIIGGSIDPLTYKCGTKVTLECGVDNPSDSMPAAITWAKDTVTVTQCFNTMNNDCLDPVVGGHQYFTSDTTAKTFTLTFNTIRMESAGVWSCEDGSNPAQQTVSVIELPRNTSEWSVTNNGTSDVTLECKTNCITTGNSSFEVSWEYQDSSSIKTLTPIDGSTSNETSLPCTATGHCVLSTSEQYTRTAKFTTSSSCSPTLQVRAKITTTDKQLTNGVDSDYIAYTDFFSTCIQGPSPGPSPDCKCDCCIHKIVWIVVSTLCSVPSLGWTLFVIKDDRRKQWLQNKLGEQAHLCMIGWVVLNLVYSIIAAILFFVLVCKNDCCEEVCACICNCWPIYIIIGYVLKAGDVIVDIIGGIAFKEGRTSKENK